MFLKHKKLILLFLLCLGLLASLPALASWPATPLLPPCTSTGCCGFNDFILLGINLTKMILGVVGSLALLFFIYGGVMFLIAGGSSEMIGKGKKIITNAVIGVALVLGAWIIVNFAIAALTGTPVSSVKIFGTQDWWKTPAGAAPSCGGTTLPSGGGAAWPTTPTTGSCNCSITLTPVAIMTFTDVCDSLRSYCSTCESRSASCAFTLNLSESDCTSLDTAARENHAGTIASHLGVSSSFSSLMSVSGSCTYSK